MRLICPNCDAQYEVSDTAIPVAGRDVQCSSCGHAWFQLPPEVEAEQAAEAALHDAPPAAPAPVAPAPVVMAPMVTAPVVTAAIAAAPDSIEAAIRTVIAPLADAPPLPPAAVATAPSQVQRQIDDSVMAVLREEAEREMIARRLDVQALETQGELGIEAAISATMQQDAASRHMARLKGEDPDAVPEPVPPAREFKRELTRREMLPDIEEINSTLRPGDVAMDDHGDAYEIVRRPEPGRSSFRSGFVLMLVLGVIGLAAYVMAPQISAQLPAAKPAMDGYVQAVDAGRLWLDGATRGLVTSLRAMTGGAETGGADTQ
jgi:predicted Zn finger-like uncharacterized protein